jgi:hypothetical protein
MDFKQIGKLIGEEVANEPAIGFYPGGFKPPHKGHFAAAKQLAAKPYINQVKVLIGHGLRGGITAEQSKAIWDLYLKAEPNPKISVEISPDNSPIKYLFTYFADLDNKGYVAGGQKEIDKAYKRYLQDINQDDPYNTINVIHNLDSAMTKHPLERDTVLYRGVSPRTLEKFKKHYEEVKPSLDVAVVA